MQTRIETFWRKSCWGLWQKRPNLGRFVFDEVWSLRSFNKLPVLKICILLQEQNFNVESWFWNWIFAGAVYCGLGSVAFQGEMVAIAAELKKGSGTTACQGVPFDLICFKLKILSQNQNWESFRWDLWRVVSEELHPGLSGSSNRMAWFSSSYSKYVYFSSASPSTTLNLPPGQNFPFLVGSRNGPSSKQARIKLS